MNQNSNVTRFIAAVAAIFLLALITIILMVNTNAFAIVPFVLCFPAWSAAGWFACASGMRLLSFADEKPTSTKPRPTARKRQPIADILAETD